MRKSREWPSGSWIRLLGWLFSSWSRFQKFKWWQQVVLILFVLWLLSFIRDIVAVSFLGYEWKPWTGFGPYRGEVGEAERGKTLWDWLGLLVIPAVLAGGAYYLNQQERKNERKISEDRIQEATLQNYLDKMAELILEHKLRETKSLREVLLAKDGKVEFKPDQLAIRDIAQVRTVTTLRQLNAERKNILLQFLRDAELAEFILENASMPGIDLAKTSLWHINLARSNLIRANLRQANLIRANLRRAGLLEADLSQAKLLGTDLRQADLFRADLRKDNLFEADLRQAGLIGANLSGAILREADLSQANLTKARVSEQELSKAESLLYVIMPDGTVHE